MEQLKTSWPFPHVYMKPGRFNYLLREHHTWKQATRDDHTCWDRSPSGCVSCRAAVTPICKLFGGADISDPFLLAAIAWFELFEFIQKAIASATSAEALQLLNIGVAVFEEPPPPPKGLVFVDMSPTLEDSNCDAGLFQQYKCRLADLLPYASCCRMIDAICNLLDRLHYDIQTGGKDEPDLEGGISLAARPLLTVLLSSDLEDQRPQADDLNSFSSRNLEMLLVEFEQVLHAQNKQTSEDGTQNTKPNTGARQRGKAAHCALLQHQSFQRLLGLPFRYNQWYVALRLLINHCYMISEVEDDADQ